MIIVVGLFDQSVRSNLIEYKNRFVNRIK